MHYLPQAQLMLKDMKKQNALFVKESVTLICLLIPLKLFQDQDKYKISEIYPTK
jgi:hypothetical protein